MRKLKSYYICNTQTFKNSNFNSQTVKLNMPGIVAVDSGHHLLKTCHATRNHLCGDLLKYQFHLLCYNISPTTEKLSSKKWSHSQGFTPCAIPLQTTIVHTTCIWLSFTATVFEESPFALYPMCKWMHLEDPKESYCCNCWIIAETWRKLPFDRLSTWSGLVTCKAYSFTRSCGTITPSLWLKYLLVLFASFNCTNKKPILHCEAQNIQKTDELLAMWKAITFAELEHLFSGLWQHLGIHQATRGHPTCSFFLLPAVRQSEVKYIANDKGHLPRKVYTTEN